MPSFTLPVFGHGDDGQDEPGAPDLVVLVSPYETGPRAVLVPRRRGDE